MMTGDREEEEWIGEEERVRVAFACLNDGRIGI